MPHDRPPSHPNAPYAYPQGVMGRLQPFKVNAILESEATLGSLSDVTVTADVGDYLRWSGTAWVDVVANQIIADTVDPTVTGDWIFDGATELRGNATTVTNPGFTGFLTFPSDSEAAAHVAVFLLKDSGGVSIWSFQKETDKSLTLRRTAGDVWQADYSTGVVDFASIPTVGAVAVALERLLVTVTGAHTVLDNEGTVLADATTAPFTVTLPPAAGHNGRTIVVKKTDSSANAVTLDANGAENIDGSLTVSISAQFEAFSVQSDGTQWWII